MEKEEFARKYLDILRSKPFALFPLPNLQGAPLDIADAWQRKSFQYVDHNQAYVTVQDTGNGNNYNIALTLVEYAVPGVLKLTRQLLRSNGDLL
jgi:hypothetical protein